MHSFLRKSNLLFLGLCALAVVATTPSPAHAVGKPKPGAGAPRGFRLFARSLGAMTINRIYCGLASNGQVCVDSTNSSTIGGGFWPKGTADQYVFNSGLQIAGIVGPDANPEWAGDTTGAFFFDPKGTTQHGEQVEPIYNTGNPEDNAFISDTTGTCNDVCKAAKVPSGDANQDLFFPLLRGRSAASQGDVWWLSWDGNPSLSAGRPHPLGILVEQRGMGWNFPAGNQDILYFLYTFYNVTASDPAVYTAAGVRPGMAQILARQGALFQQRNEAAFNIQIPDGGYTVNNLFAAFSADMDVAEATANFSSVNVPFALGYVYEHTFSGAQGWTFDPTVFSPPFFPGSGFVGVKYLKSPIVNGAEVGLTLFSNTINGGAFDDAQNTTQLFRYISNNINPAAGDAPCNTGNPQQTKICFVNNSGPNDMRFFQSSGPLTLGPGQFGTIAVAYIFAAPVITGSCPGPGACDIRPGDPTRLNNITTADNANAVDSVAGFTGYAGDAAAQGGNGNGVPDQGEFAAPVRGSLLGKALVAQQVFNFGFLLPFAPEAPDFFLVPGDNQVTVVWRASPTETTGDPFFQVANQPTITDPVTGIVGPNPLFDPNYRQFDVEGYRIYRGRVDSPNELALIAQFDYSGTSISDFTGQVNPTASCAPELGVNLPVAVDTTVAPPDTTFGCPVDFDSLVPGVAPTVKVDYPLVGPIIQVVRGDRTTLATGEAIILKADTALTGAESGKAPELSDNNVPFTYVDNGVRSNLRYFYSVTAFDINSIQSGPSNIESPRNTKSVTPSATASNSVSQLALTKTMTGRGQTLNFDAPAPALDPANLTFSGPFPPANGWDIGFVSGLGQVLAGSGGFSARLDSIGLGNTWLGIPNNYYFTATTPSGASTVIVPVTQNTVEPAETGASTPFAAATVDQSASRFGGSSAFSLTGEVKVTLPGNPYSSGFGRNVALGNSEGFPELNIENGPRWFEGDNETTPHPTANYAADPTGGFALWSNAGTLSGVTVIHAPQAYLQGYAGVGTRSMEGSYAGAARAADFKFYWGTAGAVDSVIDITHNVVVPFDTALGGGWGFLTPASASDPGSADLNAGVVTVADFMCVAPAIFQGGGGNFACRTDQPYKLVPTATLSPIQIGADTLGIRVAPPGGQTGFGLYMPGQTFIFGTAALPAAGTVWTLRSYTGAITADNTFFEQPRPLTALGVEVQLQYQATNALAASTKADLERVHTVPDPYYVTSQFEQTTDTKIIKFVNLPADCIIRIYSSSGVLVDLLEHHSETFGGAEDWNVRNRNNQIVASGVYFYHIESGDARRVGRFTVVNFAQ
jgi:hypothetical protein